MYVQNAGTNSKSGNTKILSTQKVTIAQNAQTYTIKKVKLNTDMIIAIAYIIIGFWLGRLSTNKNVR